MKLSAENSFRIQAHCKSLQNNFEISRLPRQKFWGKQGKACGIVHTCTSCRFSRLSCCSCLSLLTMASLCFWISSSCAISSSRSLDGLLPGSGVVVVAATVGEGVVGRAVVTCRLTGVVVLVALVGLRLALGLARVKTAGAARRVNRDCPLDTAEEIGLVLKKVWSLTHSLLLDFSNLMRVP